MNQFTTRTGIEIGRSPAPAPKPTGDALLLQTALLRQRQPLITRAWSWFVEDTGTVFLAIVVVGLAIGIAKRVLA